MFAKLVCGNLVVRIKNCVAKNIKIYTRNRSKIFERRRKRSKRKRFYL